MRVLLTDEILGFLEQSNVSKKNIRRLEKLETEALEDVAGLAALVRRVAQVAPRKRKRWGRLKQQHRELFQLAVEADLIDHVEPDYLQKRDDAFNDEACLGAWIEPRPWEVEPSTEDFRAAATDPARPRLDGVLSNKSTGLLSR